MCLEEYHGILFLSAAINALLWPHASDSCRAGHYDLPLMFLSALVFVFFFLFAA